LAEGILASKLPQDKFTVDSAGTGSWHIDHKPDERSIAVAKKKIILIFQIKGQRQ
jgi:protein-tyrosine phosphatase